MSIISPFEGGQFRVTSPIEIRTIPSLGIYGQPHYGLDIVGISSKKVTAVAPGVVGVSTMLDPKTDKTGTWQWGNYIRIDGDDGYKYYYCHLSQRLVKAGQRVKLGDVIGIEGATGKVTGSHLHLEKRKGTQKCAVPVRVDDPCNIAAHLGIPNAVGTYTATPKQFSDDEYIRFIVDKVGYDNPGYARWAFEQIKHSDRNALLRKLWEALNR